MQLCTKIGLDPNTQKDFAFSINTNPFTELHNHDHYEITIVTAGSVEHFINSTNQTLLCNTIVYLRPQDSHFFGRVDSSEFEYINLAFTRETFQDLLLYMGDGFNTEYFESAPMPPMVLLSPMDTHSIRKNVENFTLIPTEDVNKKKTFFRLLIIDLFFRYIQTSYEEKSLQPAWFKELLHKINDPDNFSQGTSRLEELSGKSCSYICRTFKENLRTTPTEYINDLRLNYCANRLIHSDAAIMDIAMDAGFNNLSHFYHLFKEKYHASPRQYRKTNYILL